HAVIGAEDRLGGSFRMRHQAADPTPGIGHASDVASAPVRVTLARGVSEEHAAAGLEAIKVVVWQIEVALAVGDRQAQRASRRRCPCGARSGALERGAPPTALAA